ncbi:G-protein coupled bile acid receptor 1 [Denticeps clupeoides]|uniref:G-protein coupled bile acid receptor 1 n=1 Tax=Denticeps clupeoides TaxID=299321 RepID=A0AAY4BD67_9TELE|nr:G-protein coupled bile acid receptor 1 [Denticeps clupeoides]
MNLNPSHDCLAVTTHDSKMALNATESAVSQREARLIYAITMPMSSAIILINLLIILAIASNRQLHNTPNYFFLSLLVADLCTGVALPFIPWMGLNRPLSFGTCLLVHILPNFLFLAFLFNLVMVHYERYLSIVSPLHYRTLWLHRHFLLALFGLWVPPLIFALLPAFGWNNRGHGKMWNGCCLAPNITTEANCSGPSSGERCCTYQHVFPNVFIYLEVYGILAPSIVAIVGMTGRVLWITRAQLRDIQRLERSVSQVGKRRRRGLALNLRYARCVAAVSLTFLACWVPYIIYTHVGMAFLQRPGAQPNPTSHLVLSCAGVGGMAVVPLVLGLANREYTDPVRKLVRTLRDRWKRRWDSDLIHSDPSRSNRLCIM